MRRIVIAAFLLASIPCLAQPPRLPDNVDDLLKQFDRNKDGNLTKDELPGGLADLFDRADQNKDGKLERKELEELLRSVRQRRPMFGLGAALSNTEAEVVQNLLNQMDADKDGKIAKAEARGFISDTFAQLDQNRDGFLDKSELQLIARRLMAFRQDQQGPRERDFDDYDKDADGRLTREELRGTALFEKFDEIDANKDSKIDPREYAAYLARTKKESKEPRP